MGKRLAEHDHDCLYRNSNSPAVSVHVLQEKLKRRKTIISSLAVLRNVSSDTNVIQNSTPNAVLR